MLYASIHDYTKVEQGLLKKAGGDPMAVLAAMATTTTCTTYACYALSCLGCCCCTKCAQSCIHQGDIAGAWKDSMGAFYANHTVGQRREVFFNTMLVLREIQMRLTHRMKERVTVLQQTLNDGNALAYGANELKFMLMANELNDGTWIQTVFKSVRNHLLTIPHTNPVLAPVVLTVYDTVHLTPDMYRTLAYALGFFLPATQSQYGLSSLNAGEMATIQKVSSA